MENYNLDNEPLVPIAHSPEMYPLFIESGIVPCCVEVDNQSVVQKIFYQFFTYIDEIGDEQINPVHVINSPLDAEGNQLLLNNTSLEILIKIIKENI